MRLRRIVLVGVLGALAATSVPLPVAAGGIDHGMCTHDSSRVSVPDDLAIEVCFDGGQLYFRNDKYIVVRIDASGDAGQPPLRYGTGSLSSGVIAAMGGATVLPPDSYMRFDVGSGAAEFTIVGEPGRSQILALAETVERFVPFDWVGHENDFADFFTELLDVTDDYRACLRGSTNWFGDSGCTLGWSWDVQYAVDRLALKTGITLIGGVVGAIKGLLDTSGQVSTGVHDISDFAQGSKTVTIAAVDESSETNLGDGSTRAESEPSTAGQFDLAGVWSGPVDQPNVAGYSMNLVLMDTGDGELLGVVDYSELSCGGYLEFVASDQSSVEMREKITYGNGRCVDTGTVVLQPDASGTHLSWSYSGGGLGATAQLVRRGQLILGRTHEGLDRTGRSTRSPTILHQGRGGRNVRGHRGRYRLSRACVRGSPRADRGGR